MNGLTFNDWIKVARLTDDPVGDLVGDTIFQVKNRQEAQRPPVNITEKNVLRRYMYDRHACQEAHAALDATWERYENWRRRKILVARRRKDRADSWVRGSRDG